MKRLPLLLIITTLVFIAGCSDSACYKRLIEVDSLTENDLIDSACLVIDNIEKTYDIKDGKEKAYYNLLKYQLQFRLKDDNINDSIINYSISFYNKNRDERKLALSYYLKGKKCIRNSKYKDAIKLLTKADFIAQETDDSFLKMRILGNIATINAIYEDYKTALKYELEAIKYCNKVNDIETLVWCYINTSDIYNNLKNSDSSIYFANKCIENLDKVPLNLKTSIYINAAAALEDTDTAKATEYALKSLEIAPTNNAYQILAKQARKRKDYTLSEEYLTEALKYSPSVDWEAFITHELAQTKELLGKHKEANLLEKRVIKLRDSVEYIHAQDSIKEKQVAAELEHQKETEIEEKENYIAAITISLTAIIIMTTVAYIIRRKKHKKSIDDINAMNKEMDSMAKDIDIMEKKMTDTEKQIDTYKNKIEKMTTVNKAKEKELKATTREMQRQLAQQKKEAEKRIQKETLLYKQGCDIYNKVKNGHEKVVLSNEDMSSLVTFYMNDNPEFKEKTEKTYNNLSEYQCAIIILKDMGLNSKQIANVMKTTDSAIRTAASRNRKKATGNNYTEGASNKFSNTPQ